MQNWLILRKLHIKNRDRKNEGRDSEKMGKGGERGKEAECGRKSLSWRIGGKALALSQREDQGVTQVCGWGFKGWIICLAFSKISVVNLRRK